MFHYYVRRWGTDVKILRNGYLGASLISSRYRFCGKENICARQEKLNILKAKQKLGKATYKARHKVSTKLVQS